MNNTLPNLMMLYMMGNMLMRSAKRKRLLGFVSSFCPFEIIQNRRSTAIAEQYFVYLSTTSYGREELNDSLTYRYVLAYEFAKFGKWEAPSVVWLFAKRTGSKTGPERSFSNFSRRQS